MNSTSIISDRVRLGIALLRTGHSVSAAAVKAAVTEAELDYWQRADERGHMPREMDAVKARMN